MVGSQLRCTVRRNKIQRRRSFKALIGLRTSQRALPSSRARWMAGAIIVFPQITLLAPAIDLHDAGDATS
jgi:hypothetical protein